MSLRLFTALVLCALALVPAHAAVFVVPPDSSLVADSKAIVIGTVREMHAEFAPNGDIVTLVSLELSSVLKGDLNRRETLVVRQLGGIVGSQAMGISGNVEFWVGNRALLFLDRDAEGYWTTYGLSLGKFDFVRDRKGRELAVRWSTSHDDALAFTPDGRPHEEQLRSAEPFIAWIRSQTSRLDATASAEAGYFVDPVAEETSEPNGPFDIGTEQSTYPASAYSVSPPYRWDTFDKGGSVTFYTSGTQPGYDSEGAAQRALAAWTNDPGSNVRYLHGGQRTAGFVVDGINSIGFNNTTDVPAGNIAYAKWAGGAQHDYKGELFITIIEGDVVVKSGLNISQKVLDEAVTHELGHTLGFRHSDQGTPSSTQAVMKASLSGAYGATLGPWDVDAVRTVYASTTTTTPAPSAPANLIATATSTTSITVTWSAATNATGYQLERSTNINAGFTLVASPQSTSYVDSGRAPNTTYVYRVRAVGGGGTSGYSNLDHATTILFTDDPLSRGVVVKAVHLAELRTAVSAVRAAAGLAPVSAFTDPPARGVIIKAVHIVELRNALTPALAALGKSAAYTDPTLGRGFPVRAVHIQELRNYTK